MRTGVDYIREVVGDSSWRFLVVANDIRGMGVGGADAIRCLGSIDNSLDTLPGPLAELDHTLKEEAGKVLRRVADVADDVYLLDAACELMKLKCVCCHASGLDWQMDGRWSVFRGRHDGKAWRNALNRILKVRQEGGGKRLGWRNLLVRDKHT